MIAFARSPNRATRLCDLILGPTECNTSKGHGRRRMFQQRWRLLKDANIAFRMWAMRAASHPIAASCTSGPLHRSLPLDLSVYLVISRGGRRKVTYCATRIRDGRERRRPEEDSMITSRSRRERIPRQLTTGNFSAREQTGGSKE